MSVRFAPSPTGHFHVGNLRTAWVSYTLAKQYGLPWVVRFEDIDAPRVTPGAQDHQLLDMAALGLKPDQVLIQSTQHARHESLFRAAIQTGHVYACSCSRKELLAELQGIASAPHSVPPVYNGRCRNPVARAKADHPTLAWRFLNPVDPMGHQDFIIGRTRPDGSEFVPSYHWACAIDDHDGAHTLLVRASDLAHVIPQQRLIHQWVGNHENTPRPYPAVFHTSLVTDNNGHRLEKRTKGATLKELLDGGLSAEQLVALFEKSFQAPAQPKAEEILHEQKATLTIEALLQKFCTV